MTTSGQRDFDFLMGRWRVAHRRLVLRLAGSDDWQVFGGRCEAKATLAGHGNLDDNVLELPAGTYRAMAMRAFDPATRLWAIWWLDGRTPHRLDPPVVGRFEHGVGTFEADDLFEGRPVRVRFRWTDTATPSPHWEQAFSADGGATWEVNWTMRFTRA